MIISGTIIDHLLHMCTTVLAMLSASPNSSLQSLILFYIFIMYTYVYGGNPRHSQPDAGGGHLLFFLLIFMLFFETRYLNKSNAHCFGGGGWPVSSGDLPVSAIQCWMCGMCPNFLTHNYMWVLGI